MKRGSTQPGVETALCLQGKCDFFTRDGNAHGWRTKKQFFFFRVMWNGKREINRCAVQFNSILQLFILTTKYQ